MGQNSRRMDFTALTIARKRQPQPRLGYPESLRDSRNRLTRGQPPPALETFPDVLFSGWQRPPLIRRARVLKTTHGQRLGKFSVLPWRGS